ncbi:probable membrane-associated kinase regulator 4 [Durio zibethinus]|uniref:Probable membrane-associated kinase regulator 4 n=1 Tax=Durio zibethinus TaxID=66656 RepID=A0A6P6AI58_DURZI|nr:probable membrane-associated kinase regulator 4 [Durio zibethinus]
MAVSLLSNDLEDEEYIDMEVSSYSNSFCNSRSSPPHPREFEFQMSSVSMEREPTTSPADELFYKGKLLPLHLPPRLQMVEKLLQNSNSVYEDRKDNFEEFCSAPLTTTVTTPTTTSTPFESCNISPSESCRVSRELNPEEYFLEYSTEVSGCIGENQKKSWTKKLKLIKQSSIGSKLKASRAYLKSLFGKSGCSDESCAAAKVADEGSVSKAKGRLDRYMKSTKKNPFGQIHQNNCQISTAVLRSFDKEKISDQNNANRHRRSFSLAIKRNSTNKSSSSSSSSGSSSSSSSNASNGYQNLQFLKRSSSVNAEIESPIQGAIAHCKQSQQLIRSRKTVSEVGFYSLSDSSIAVCEDQERPDLCRG